MCEGWWSLQALGDEQHLFLPLVGEGVYGYDLGSGLAGHGLGIAVVELALQEEAPYALLPCRGDGLAELGGRGLTPLFLDRQLGETVVAGIVGERGVVDEEGGALVARELLADAGVELSDAAHQILEIGLEVEAVLSVDGGQRPVDVVGDGDGVGGTHPRVGVIVAGGGAAGFDALRRVYDDGVGGCLLDALHPGALKSYLAHLYVEVAAGEAGYLLGRGLVDFGIGPGGHHSAYLEAVAGYLCGEIAQRLYAHHNASPVGVVAGGAGGEQEQKGE